MKGPGMRIELDVRRVWQCPNCQKQVRAEGDVVFKLCGCTREGTPMRLVEPQRRQRPAPTMVVRDEASPLDALDMPAPNTHDADPTPPAI